MQPSADAQLQRLLVARMALLTCVRSRGARMAARYLRSESRALRARAVELRGTACESRTAPAAAAVPLDRAR